MQIFIILAVVGAIIYIASKARPDPQFERKRDVKYVQDVMIAVKKGTATPEMVTKAKNLIAKYGLIDL